MPSRFSISNWQLPKGVTHGTWDYVRGNQIADDYDDFLDGNPLHEWESEILESVFPAPPTGEQPIIADFGAGTGRSLLPLVSRGYRGLAIDLSLPMLRRLKAKGDAMSLTPSRIMSIRANLVELDGIMDDVCDHGVCLFSTLGMICGHHLRADFLGNCRRIIRPGGKFVVHAHNYWNQLTHAGGFRWAAQNLWRAIRGHEEIGDRESDYRGVKNMFIHSYRRNELSSALQQAGFKIAEVYKFLPEVASGRKPCVGWIIVCH